MRNKGLIHPCLVEHNRDGNLDSFGPKPVGAEIVGLVVRTTKSNVNTVYMVWVLYFQYAHDLGGWAKPAEVTAMSVGSHIDFSLHLWVTQSASVRDRINSDNSSERSWQEHRVHNYCNQQTWEWTSKRSEHCKSASKSCTDLEGLVQQTAPRLTDVPAKFINPFSWLMFQMPIHSEYFCSSSALLVYLILKKIVLISSGHK